MDFLLPHVTYHERATVNVEAMSKFLINLFDEWTSDSDTEIKIRLFNSILSVLTGGISFLKGVGPDNDAMHICVTIFSNGDIAPPAEFCSAGDEFMKTGMNVSTTEFIDIFKHPSFMKIEESYTFVAEKCQECCWKNVCAGWDKLHRFSKTNGFNNPSAYCECLRNLFDHIARSLVKSGYPINSLMDTLCGEKFQEA
jgi:uncharacterized protein